MARRDNLADDWPPLRTITDLALGHWNVRLSCPHCKYIRVVSGGGLWYLFYNRHWSDNVREAPRRLFCARCRVRNGKKVAPRIEKTKDAPTGDSLPDPSDYEWKKLIARHRS
ncbi:hypothetical protein TS85_18975 [Sphingomonas hengshuiensis]|uniref:Uncharacterized protein n=1 Tax=Sphingomonas hengshuiensis TaxID=1609977 RepID=A0A7U4LGR5_9SPHN|nr:hypothetical protein TS85_18975 [Sphingomonas hengshuiensis]